MYKKMLIALWTVVSLPGHAMEGPKVEYSADQTLETADVSMQGHLNVAAGRERREMMIQGQKTLMIQRHDRKLAWTLMPNERMYMEMALKDSPAKSTDLSDYKVLERTRVGEETVNGVAATKYKMIVQGPNGAKMGGFQWITRENIAVRLDMIAVGKKDKTRMKMDLTNLKVGKQDPNLFEIPEGYRKMQMGGFGMPGAIKMMR